LKLFPNEKTPVKVLVRFDKPTKVRGIHALFHGAERTEATYTVTTTDSKGRSKTETRTAVEHVDIVREEFLLFGAERKGFFSRLGDSMATWVGGGSHEVIQPGEQEFTLELGIPEHAPASFKGKKCEVFYRLKVSVDLPIKYDWSQSRDFEVAPKRIDFRDTAPIHVVFPDESGRSFWDKTIGKDVKLNVAVDRDTLSVGEQALAMLTVESPEPLKVDKMEISLVGKESCEAHGHTDSHAHNHPLGQIDSPQVISSQSVHEFEIVVPQLEVPHTQSGEKFSVDWTIEVRLYIPWAKDPTIKVPVTILPAVKNSLDQ
jgi:hypothetical protein